MIKLPPDIERQLHKHHGNLASLSDRQLLELAIVFLERLMSAQDDVNTEVQAIEDVVTNEKADLANIVAEVSALEAQVAAGGAVDLTGLKQAVADAQAEEADEAAVAPAPAPAPEPAPPAA